MPLTYAIERLRKAASGLPQVEECTSYGTPAFKLRKKFLCRVKDADTVVLMCPVEEKDLLMAAAPAAKAQARRRRFSWSISLHASVG